MPLIYVESPSDGRVEIVPISSGLKGSLPQSLVSISSDLPLGTLLITNHTDTPITAVVVSWSYKMVDGTLLERRVNCDGYLDSPAEPIIGPNQQSLVTPYSCTTQDLFPRIVTGELLGSPLDPKGRARIPASDTVASVTAVVDSVIFGDGEIWGRDKFQYYSEIEDRYLAAQEVVSEVTQARAAGETVASILGKIRRDVEGKKDRQSIHKDHYAALIQRSPNANGTLEYLARQTPPKFHHTGDPHQ
jgi:hypothetical protein